MGREANEIVDIRERRTMTSIIVCVYAQLRQWILFKIGT